MRNDTVSAPDEVVLAAEKVARQAWDQSEGSTKCSALRAKLASIVGKLSALPNRSAELERLLTQYSNLEGQLGVLDITSPEALKTLADLEKGVQALDEQLKQADAVGLAQAGLKLTAEPILLSKTALEAAINGHILIIRVDNRIKVLRAELVVLRQEAKILSQVLDPVLADASKGLDDFHTVAKVAAIADTQTTQSAKEAVIDKAEAQLKAQAKEEEDQLIKDHVITTQRELDEHRVRREERMKRFRDAFADIKKAGGSVRAALMRAYHKLVVKPVYDVFVPPPPVENVRPETVQAYANQVTQQMQKMGTDVVNHSESIYTLKEYFDTHIDYMKNGLSSLGSKKLVKDVEADIEKMETARELLTALMKAEENTKPGLKKAANLLGMDPKDLAQQVGAFRAQQGLPGVPSMRDNAIDKVLNVFRGTS